MPDLADGGQEIKKWDRQADNTISQAFFPQGTRQETKQRA